MVSRRRLTLYSEPYQPIGNIDARAAKRAMGKSSLDPWTIFLRETLQNSWDAKLRDHGPISFRADAWWATVDQQRTLRTWCSPRRHPTLISMPRWATKNSGS